MRPLNQLFQRGLIEIPANPRLDTHRRVIFVVIIGWFLDQQPSRFFADFLVGSVSNNTYTRAVEVPAQRFFGPFRPVDMLLLQSSVRVFDLLSEIFWREDLSII